MIVEIGVGVKGANSYAPITYVDSYLSTRGRSTENSWDTLTEAVKESAIISATDYIEKRFSSKFKGSKSTTFAAIDSKGYITFTGQPTPDDTLILGDQTYKFVSTLVDANDILIGATKELTAAALVAAINLTGTVGTVYGTGTLINRYASSTLEGAMITLTSLASGSNGNFVTLSGSPDNITLTVFSGGVDGGDQPLSWPRDYVYSSKGTLILGVPDIVKQAVSEYAVRHVSATLLPDPSNDSYGASVKRIKEKVGPIEEETEYVSGTEGKDVFTKYPAADRLLRPLLKGSGGVIRG